MRPGSIEIANGRANPGSDLRIRAPSQELLALSSAPLLLGLPDPRRRDGRAVLAGVARGRVRIAGLLRHPVSALPVRPAALGDLMGADPPLPPPPARERRLLPALTVLAVLAAVVLGGYATAGVLSSPAGPPVDVAGLVRVRPLSGWELARRFDDPPGARLTRGSANLDVLALSFAGTSEALLRDYVDSVLEREGRQLSVSGVETVALASGLEGARVSYVGTFGDVPSPIEGEATAVVSASGVGVIFDGWAPSGLLQYARGDVETMIERAEVA